MFFNFSLRPLDIFALKQFNRVGKATSVAEGLRDLDDIPTPETNPDFFVDYLEVGPYVANVAESECAT